MLQLRAFCRIFFGIIMYITVQRKANGGIPPPDMLPSPACPLPPPPTATALPPSSSATTLPPLLSSSFSSPALFSSPLTSLISSTPSLSPSSSPIPTIPPPPTMIHFHTSSPSPFFSPRRLRSWTFCCGPRSRKCQHPGCKGLNKAMEFDLQLQTEDCFKSGASKEIDRLPCQGGSEPSCFSELDAVAPSLSSKDGGPNAAAVIKSHFQ